MAGKRKRRLVRINRLRNLLLCAYVAHDNRQRHLSGFRVVRIVQTIYDRKLKRVVKIKARAYSSAAGRKPGYTGKLLVLAPAEFTGPACGILATSDAKTTTPVDVYVQQLQATKARRQALVADDYAGLFDIDTT